MNGNWIYLLVLAPIAWFVFDLFRQGVWRFPNPPRTAFYQALHKEHEAGWIVVLDGEQIASLDYLHDDQPFHIFKFTLLTNDQSRIAFALHNTSRRDPSDRVILQNRGSGTRLTEQMFVANLYQDEVRLRDWRHWNPDRKTT